MVLDWDFYICCYTKRQRTTVYSDFSHWWWETVENKETTLFVLDTDRLSITQTKHTALTVKHVYLTNIYVAVVSLSTKRKNFEEFCWTLKEKRHRIAALPPSELNNVQLGLFYVQFCLKVSLHTIGEKCNCSFVYTTYVVVRYKAGWKS